MGILTIEKFISFIDCFLPKNLKADDEEGLSEELRKYRLVTGMSLVLSPLIFIMFILRWMSEDWRINPTLFMLPLTALFFASMPFMVKYRKAQVALVIMSLIPLVVIPIRILDTGGLSSTVTSWYLLAPIVTTMLLSSKGNLIVCVLIIIQLFVLANWEMFGLPINDRPISNLVQFYVAAVAVVISSLLNLVYEGQRKRYMRLILEKNGLLEEQKNRVFPVTMCDFS